MYMSMHIVAQLEAPLLFYRVKVILFLEQNHRVVLKLNTWGTPKEKS